jgi:hypothetical protein
MVKILFALLLARFMHIGQDFSPRVSRISRMGNPAFLIGGISEIRGFSSVAACPRYAMATSRHGVEILTPY